MAVRPGQTARRHGNCAVARNEDPRAGYMLLPPMRTPAQALGSALLATLAACGGGGGGGSSEPPILPNEPPAIQAPQTLTGTSPSYSLTLPVAQTAGLTFLASDPENALLQWQLAVDGAGAVATGLTFTTPLSGNVFQLDVAAVAVPAAATMTLLVEDPRGGVAAIDLRIVRSGPPTLTAVEPGSAFATRPQTVRLTGTSLRLGGTANTLPSFDSLAGTGVVVASDTLLTCSTPNTAAVGPTVVAVTNQFGGSALPSSAFTMHAFPPALFAADTRLDAGSASALQIARTGDTVHAVWLEGNAAVHRVSTDRGLSWSSPQTLSGAENASEPQLAIDGTAVSVAWIGDNSAVWLRRSSDAGTTFDAAQRLDAPSPPTTIQRPRLAQDGDNRYVAWLAGSTGLGTARVVAAASANGGIGFSTPLAVDDGGANQANHELACDGATAWVLCEDNRAPSLRGAFVVRTTDGGSSWLPGQRLNSPAVAASEVRLAVGASRVYASWVQNGSMFMVTSPDRGATWGNTLVELQGNQAGAVSAVRAQATDDGALFTYLVGSTVVRVARFFNAGSSVQQATVATATALAATPVLAGNGNYVFVAYRDGDVGTGTARVRFAVSVNGGGSFEAATGFGDGAAAQELPQLAVAGANLLLGWLDRRDPTPGVFVNRTAQ